MGENDQLTVLVCLLCGHLFNTDDIRRLQYFSSTNICFECYACGQQAAHANWCFGKTTFKDGKVHKYGYDPRKRACREECPDRKICPLFVTGTIFKWRKDL